MNVEVRRSPALKLEARPSIKAALGESHGLPTNRSNDQPEPQKLNQVQGGKPAPRRANFRKS